MQVSTEGSTITVDGAEDEVTIVFRKVDVVAVVSMEHDDEVDTIMVVTNVVGHIPAMTP